MKKQIWIAAAAASAVILAVVVITLVFLNQPQVVGISYRENTNSANMAFRRALEDTLSAQGIRVVITDADGDQQKQLEQIAQLRDQKCQALIVEPVSAEGGEMLVKAISQTGLPAVLCNRELPASLLEGVPNIAYVGLDGRQAGTQQGKLVLQLPNCGDINGDGTTAYFLMAGPENHSQALVRVETVRQVLAGGEQDVQELTVTYGEWTKESGQALCSQELAKYGKDIEVILCTNDQMAIGAEQAIADGGRTVGKDVFLLGIDGDSGAVELVEQGRMTATVSQNEPGQIQAIVEAVLAQLKGQTVTQYQIIPYVTITGANTEES